MSSSFKCTWASDQTVTGDGTDNQLLPDTKAYDPDNAFDVSMGCWSPPVPAGSTAKVLLSGQAVWGRKGPPNTAPGSASYGKVWWKKNDVVLVGSENRTAGSASGANLGTPAVTQDIASPGDKYEAYITIFDGGNTSIVQGKSDGRSFIAGTML